MGTGLDYPEMNELAASVPIGSDGLSIFPYGNGAERTLENKVVDASIHGLNFNIHTRAHVLRAAQEGIVFAFNYGLEIMKAMGVEVSVIRAGKANMFLSPVFGQAMATVANAQIELYNTDGSQGAARGAGIGAGVYKDFPDAFVGFEKVGQIHPDAENESQYRRAYEKWCGRMNF